MALTKIPRGLLDTGIADSSDATAITIDSSENVTFAGNILKTGNLTLDVSGTLILDSDDGDLQLRDGGTQFASLYKSSNDFIVRSMISDGAFKIQGNDGGSTITAMTIDMSEGGRVGIGTSTPAHELDISGGNLSTFRHNSLRILSNTEGTGSETNIMHNVKYDSGYKYVVADEAARIQFIDGKTTISRAVAGSAGAAATWLDTVTFNATGKVGIGINAPSYQLDVRTASGNWGVVHSDGTRKVATYIDTNGNDGLYTVNSMPLTLGSGGTAQLQLDTAGTLRVGNPAGVPTPGSGWDANLDAIQVGEASAFRSGDSDYSAATYVSTNLYQTGGGDKLLNGTDYAAQYLQQGGNHYFYSYENGSANATPAAASNDLANPLLIYKGGGLQISQGSVSNTANGKAGIFWGGAPQDGADYCIRRTNHAWSGANDYAQLLIDWDTGVKIDVGNDAYGKSFLEVNGPISTFSDFAPHDYADLTSWSTRGISVNLHPSLEASGNAIDHCDNARNMGIRVLVHSSTTSATNRPTAYGTIWCDQHYYSNLSGSKGAKYVMQKLVGHSSTPLEYRRNTDTSNGTTWGSWYTVDHTAVSDVREKKNIIDAPAQLESLKKIRVRKFDFKNDLDPNAQLGMIAQELDTTLPEYVWKQHDKDTGEVIEDLMWRIRYKDMIPMLIKSIQELSAEVEALKAK